MNEQIDKMNLESSLEDTYLHTTLAGFIQNKKKNFVLFHQQIHIVNNVMLTKQINFHTNTCLLTFIDTAQRGRKMFPANAILTNILSINKLAWNKHWIINWSIRIHDESIKMYLFPKPLLHTSDSRVRSFFVFWRMIII